MDDKALFTKILGLRPPWFIKHVCDQFYGLYDHAPERVYRHLDTCQMRTFIHVRLPRVNCPTHGIKQVGPEFGDNGSELTFGFESFVIRVAPGVQHPGDRTAVPAGVGSVLKHAGARGGSGPGP